MNFLQGVYENEKLSTKLLAQDKIKGDLSRQHHNSQGATPYSRLHHSQTEQNTDNQWFMKTGARERNLNAAKTNSYSLRDAKDEALCCEVICEVRDPLVQREVSKNNEYTYPNWPSKQLLSHGLRYTLVSPFPKLYAKII